MLLKDISLHRHLSITIQGEDDVFATVQTIDFDFWTKVFLKHFCCRDRNNIFPPLWKILKGQTKVMEAKLRCDSCERCAEVNWGKIGLWRVVTATHLSLTSLLPPVFRSYHFFLELSSHFLTCAAITYIMDGTGWIQIQLISSKIFLRFELLDWSANPSIR